MKNSTIKGKLIDKNVPNDAGKTSSLTTEERLTVFANLIIDKLLEKYGTNLAKANK
jgi:hypothetical protein